MDYRELMARDDIEIVAGNVIYTGGRFRVAVGTVEGDTVRITDEGKAVLNGSAGKKDPVVGLSKTELLAMAKAKGVELSPRASEATLRRQVRELLDSEGD